MGIKKITSYLLKETSILPLAIFRMAFGFLMCFSMFRFIFNGWIEKCYTNPEFHFTYQFFDWIQPLDVNEMYIVVIICALSALLIGLGFLYRIATILFFISFTYLELIEKSWYLNHYYFVSLVAFLLILVPANKNYSVETKIFKNLKLNYVHNWTILIFKLQLCVVYLFGGIAKIKSDWLLNAQPLKIWLKAKTDVPLIGWLFEYDITPYLFSWSGMLYDLTIPFLLFIRKTRPIAYIFVVVFHVLTYVLFNIGMFPWLMIFGSLVFITHQEWNTILGYLGKKINLEEDKKENNSFKTNKIVLAFLAAFFAFQFLFPLRYHLLTNNVLWTENGLRFAWHVMIMEKNGFAEFTVFDKKTSKRWVEYPKNHLTTTQEKQMSFQPDMIWQYAQFLKDKYAKKGITDVAIFVDSRVSLNGRVSQKFINPKKDLLEIKDVDAIYKAVLKLN
ncbi:Vitamin K-dependent gamma-carboxylase [Polaribacter sp. KT25b]|uniref:HTTM domain-containing protein n=1 Tax=Polaribacter sp. KT25b TaxID=1855336 RepID=UPI00087DEBA5|nr:HTTM domain-containing protein [Polaribacter sp. KT25b]SDS06363.1 Vitamin K-dependent gamma-carboxylase [Polaribacter sp. KT25b]